MSIAVMSDTHDNIWKLGEAIPYLVDVEAVLHCGDLISPFIIDQLASNIRDKPIHIVWGNNDGDKRILVMKAFDAGNIFIHGDFVELKIAGLSIAINHYPQIARALAVSTKYDLVCFGHDHNAYKEQVGDTLLLNPGEIMGLNGKSSLAILDTNTREVTWIELDD